MEMYRKSLLRFNLIVCILMLVFSLCSCGSKEAEPENLNFITTEDANLRSVPDKQSEVIGVIKKGSVVAVDFTEEIEEWYKVSYENQTGYVHKSLVKQEAPKKFFSDGFWGVLAFVLLVVVGIAFIALFVASMKSAAANRIITLLLNITRIVLIIIWSKSALDLYAHMGFYMALITFILTLYSFGSSAFDDTREESVYFALDPIGNGGYKLVQRSEVIGDSPFATFLSAVVYSAVIAGIMLVVCWVGSAWLAANAPGLGETMGYILLPLIIAIVGIIRAVISLVKYFLD